MSVTPFNPDNKIPSYTIATNGNSIPDTCQIVEILVKMGENSPHQAEIKMIANSTHDDTFEHANSSSFEIGIDLQISLGYDSKNTIVFRGNISEKHIRIDDSMGAMFIISCTSSEMVPKLQNSRDPVLELTYGRDIIETELHLGRQTPKTIDGYLCFQGYPAVMLGDSVTIKGFGKQFSSTVITNQITHHLYHGHWVTQIAVKSELQEDN